jgi:hypothetical protein
LLLSERAPGAIGGDLELELPARRVHFHDKALRLNSGRSCLAYVVVREQVQKLYLPYFSCASLLEPLEFHGVGYEFYRLDKDFEIATPPVLRQNERLLYINYFGMKTDYVSRLISDYGSLVIADNTQCFFSAADPRCPAFCSPRKFFGVPDGGYVDGESATAEISSEFKDQPIQYSHLIGRIEHGPQAYFRDYQANEKGLTYDGIRRMSRFSERVLASIDYARVQMAREANFRLLHEALGAYNNLDIQPDLIPGPLCYPLWNASGSLRQTLIENLIFVPTYWEEVPARLSDAQLIEASFAREILPVPVDQRYSEVEMQRIIDVVRKGLRH